MKKISSCAVVILLLAANFAQAQNKVSADKEASMKADLSGQVDQMKKQAQVMVDSVFSFGELGFQEFETSKYLTGILEKEGFKIEELESLLSRLVPISTISRRLRRSPASLITIQ
jgi:aminobenzoyl-glutamate utilization protein B